MGASIIHAVIENSGLPEEYARQRLESLLTQAGVDPEKATIEDVRLVLVDFLQDMILNSELN